MAFLFSGLGDNQNPLRFKVIRWIEFFLLFLAFTLSNAVCFTTRGDLPRFFVSQIPRPCRRIPVYRNLYKNRVAPYGNS